MPIGLNPRAPSPGQMNRPMGNPGQMNKPMGQKQPGMMNPKITAPKPANPLNPKAPRANPKPKQPAPQYQDPGLLNMFLPPPSNGFGPSGRNPDQDWYDDQMSTLHRFKPPMVGAGPEWERAMQRHESEMRAMQEFRRKNPTIKEWTPPPPPPPPKPPKGTPTTPGYNAPILPHYRYPEQLNNQPNPQQYVYGYQPQQDPTNYNYLLRGLIG